MNFGHFLAWLNFYLFHAKFSPAIFGAGTLLTTSSSPTTSFAAFVTSVAISSLLITEGTPQSISTSVDPRKVAAVHLAALLFDHELPDCVHSLMHTITDNKTGTCKQACSPCYYCLN